MDWLQHVPWGAILTVVVTLLLGALGVWSAYLIFRTATTKDIAAAEKAIIDARTKAKEDHDTVNRRLDGVDRILERVSQEIPLTNARITVTEKSIIELGARAVTREDLKEVRTDLTKEINNVGDRMERNLDRVVEALRTHE